MFRDEFIDFLNSSGVTFNETGEDGFYFPDKDIKIFIAPLGSETTSENGIHIFEDRWRKENENIKKRILAHLGQFRSIFARKCETRRIDSPTAESFLDKYHSYGGARSRFRYGLFNGQELVAVATFSSGRKMTREICGKPVVVISYEWIRYASLPDTRISGGMGKLLSAFVNDIHPEEVMSYADLEWSDGNVYRELGFTEYGRRSPVEFYIDPKTWRRIPVLKSDSPTEWKIKNLGSVKYLKRYV